MNLRLLILAVAACLLPLTSFAGDWIQFENETFSRLDAMGSLGINDVAEKDYAWGDVDMDGDVDLICVRKEPYDASGHRTNVLFLNENGVLVDRSVDFASASDVPGDQGFLTPTGDRDVELVDVTGDGWLDIVTAAAHGDGFEKHISHPRVYRNLGLDPQGNWNGFLYEDARIPVLECCDGSVPYAPRFGAVASGDIDNDGDMDLFFAEYFAGTPQAFNFENRLLVNDGTGFFTDETFLALTPEMYQSSLGAAAEIHDMNGDGARDIIKHDGSVDTLVGIAYNDDLDPGSFASFDLVYDIAAYFVEVGDLNNDSLPDLVIADDFDDQFLLNTGNDPDGNAVFSSHVFDFETSGDDGFASNTVIGDLDRDGFDDVLICDVDFLIPGCTRRLHIYRNLGNVPQVNLQEEGVARPWTPTGVHDVALLDIDGNDTLDLVIGRCSGTQVWMNQAPGFLAFDYPQGIPEFLTPDEATSFTFQVSGIAGSEPVAGSALVWVSVDGAPFVSQAPVDLGGELYEVSLPAVECLTPVRFYVAADVDGGSTRFDPASAPDESHLAIASLPPVPVIVDQIEGSTSGWQIMSDPSLTAGEWIQATPVGTLVGDSPAAPGEDATPGPGGQCFVTENGNPGGPAGAADVDGGPTRLTTPFVDAQGNDLLISWSQWFYNNDVGTPGGDFLEVEITGDGGNSWLPVLAVESTLGTWEPVSILASEYVTPVGMVALRFSVMDEPNNSVTEAGIDDLVVSSLSCSPIPLFQRGDFDADGILGIQDAIQFLSFLFQGGTFPQCDDSADANDDGLITLTDGISILSALFGTPTVPLPAPFQSCGVDPSGDGLGCGAFPGCP